MNITSSAGGFKVVVVVFQFATAARPCAAVCRKFCMYSSQSAGGPQRNAGQRTHGFPTGVSGGGKAAVYVGAKTQVGVYELLRRQRTSEAFEFDRVAALAFGYSVAARDERRTVHSVLC